MQGITFNKLSKAEVYICGGNYVLSVPPFITLDPSVKINPQGLMVNERERESAGA